jgi:hypothetical protein
MGFGSVAYLAGAVNRVYYCVNEGWVADDGLVIHKPNIHDASSGVDGVEGVLGVLLDEKGTSFVGCHLNPLGSFVNDVLPGCLPCCLVGWSVVDLGPREGVLCLGLVDDCSSVAGLLGECCCGFVFILVYENGNSWITGFETNPLRSFRLNTSEGGSGAALTDANQEVLSFTTRSKNKAYAFTGTVPLTP